MSDNTDRIQLVQQIIADVLLPLVKAAEQTQVDVAGEPVDIPQQVKAKLKQKVTAARVDCVTELNKIQVN